MAETRYDRKVRQLRAKGFSEEEIEKRLLEDGLLSKADSSEEIFISTQMANEEGY